MTEPAPAIVQFWVTSTGGGHRRVAEAVRDSLLSSGPAGLSVAIDDPLAYGALPHARLLLRGYGPLVRTSPGVWGFLFDTFARPWARTTLEAYLVSGLSGAMDRASRSRRPRVIVNCHPLLGPSASRVALRMDPRPEFLTLITDMTVVHPGWLSPRDARFLVPSSVAYRWCLEQGVPEHQLVEVGLPVDPKLTAASSSRRDRAGERRKLGLDPGRPLVLLGGGGEGAGDLQQLVSALANSGLPVQLAVMCGRNTRLRRWVVGHPGLSSVVALPYLQDPSPWLLAADVYVGKAGPSALAEAAACGLAMVVTHALPGQESRNRSLLVESGVALGADGTVELLEVLARLCASDGSLLARMQQAARGWARPDAAFLAAREILSRLPGSGFGDETHPLEGPSL